ncbi:hypothetical protein [Persicobacter psychrovividus]|uniref:Uncharacterized protein n=1 Tax=Persicobacter psychrovividus TaxID=387638 RepID=A0ABN6LCV3_9BACT|nr:hypothetical protein PEPS_29640 [Persicobacter psychrovividus]
MNLNEITEKALRKFRIDFSTHRVAIEGKRLASAAQLTDFVLSKLKGTITGKYEFQSFNAEGAKIDESGLSFSQIKMKKAKANSVLTQLYIKELTNVVGAITAQK